MGRTIKLNRLETVLGELEYPLDGGSAAAACEDVTLVLADGEANLGAIIAESTNDSFESVDDLASEVMNLLPRRAVGEPYQSEGDS